MGAGVTFQPSLECDRGAQKERQPTVLLVEDDENTRFAMDKLLLQWGYLVLTAETGHDAIGTLERPLAPVDVVLLDAHLPDVDGPALAARLRELEPTLPIVVCTGEADAEEVAALVRSGAVRCFRKPIAADELRAAVDNLLN